MPKVSPAHEQQRRDQILAAAMACFARQGYHATSMDDVVRQSGLSVGALYTYFPSKEDLFLALAESRSEQTLRYLNELFRRPGPLEQKSQQAIDYFFELLSDEFVPLARVNLEFWSQAAKSDRVQAWQSRRCDMLRQFYVWLLGQAQRDGEIRADVDIAAAAELLMALNEGILTMYVAGVGSVPRDALKAAYVAFVNGGLASPTSHFFPTAVAPMPNGNHR
jgi:AcrR family transcriptional regulator